MTGVTRRQSQLLGFIAEHIEQHGCPPTYDAMAEELGVVSKSTIAEMIYRLEERGHVTRLPGRRQTIEVIDTDAVRRAVRFRSLSRENSAARPGSGDSGERAAAPGARNSAAAAQPARETV